MEVAEKKKGISELTFDQLTALRVSLTAKIKEAEAVVDGIKDKRAKVDVEILRRFNEQGITSVKTSAGTPYIVERSSVTIADKDAFMGWMQAENCFDFMEVRASKPMVEAYKAAHNDLPPGLNWSTARTIGVKRT